MRHPEPLTQTLTGAWACTGMPSAAGLDIITRAQATTETEEVTDPDLQAISA